jgi:hypothetical protein
MSEQKTQEHRVELNPPPHEQRGGLPVVIAQAPPRPQRGGRPRVVLIALLLVIGACAGIGWLWWQEHQTRLPPGIASGNGRLESDAILPRRIGEAVERAFHGRLNEVFDQGGYFVRVNWTAKT